MNLTFCYIPLVYSRILNADRPLIQSQAIHSTTISKLKLEPGALGQRSYCYDLGTSIPAGYPVPSLKCHIFLLNREVGATSLILPDKQRQGRALSIESLTTAVGNRPDGRGDRSRPCLVRLLHMAPKPATAAACWLCSSVMLLMYTEQPIIWRRSYKVFVQMLPSAFSSEC